MIDDEAEDERFPLLGQPGRRMLAFLREHPAAPIFRNRSGHKLRADDLPGLRAFERETLAATIGWRHGQTPAWLPDFIAHCHAQVPYYRALGAPPRRFEDLPTIDRGDLAADIARFVPDDLPLDRFINFRTTGTTGQPLLIASHPVVAARYLAFHKRALRRFGIELSHRSGQVGVVLLGHQRECFTYVSVTPLMDESGLAKINLHPDDWRDPDDRARYLDALDAEVFAGDPISFAALLELPLNARPKALVSVSMMLSPALRERLAARFGCPVLDVYSLNEVGPVAVFDTAAGGHVLLQPHLHVEILDPDGRPLPPGERGEITVSGGFNFCLPLLRYRTGDFAALRLDGEPALLSLEGRAPLRFRNRAGDWFNNIDVTHALRHVPLSRYRFQQGADGALTLALAASEQRLAAPALAALQALFGDQPIALRTLTTEDKTIQYASDLAGACA